MSDADALHRRVLDHDWEDDFALARRVLADPACDRGTALLVFWCASPAFHQQFRAEDEVPPHARAGWRIVRELLRDYPGRWPTSRIAFDPRRGRKGDLTRGVLGEGARWEIPAAFFAPSCEGEEPPAERLRDAVVANDAAACRAALERGADPNAAVVSAAAHAPECLALLLAAGADPNQKAKGLGSALVQAVRCDRLASVRALLASGAKVDVRHEGDTPLGEALALRRPEIVDALLAAGAKPKKASLPGVVRGGPDAVARLLAAGVPIDQTQRDGETALFRAADLGLPAVVEALLAAGADRALGRKKDGKVALDKAREGASRHGRDPARGPAYAACVALLEG